MNKHEVAINGVNIAATILNIPVPHYSFFDPSEISNKEITGMYVFESDEILFNDEWVTNSPWIEVIITAFHETRHAYQGFCIKNRLNESKETLDKWEYESLNYISPTGRNNEEDDHDYLKQSIEIDAIGFTHHTIDNFFGVKTVIPYSIKDIALNYLKNKK